MYLLRLEIENVRAIRSMIVDFRASAASSEGRKWTVLLGENGCGKSTILKSIGLVLAGSEALSDLIGEPSQWVRVGEERAKLVATICTATGEERTVSLIINRNDRRDVVIRNNSESLRALDDAIGHADRNYFIAGYGAFRRPPSNSEYSSPTRSRRRRGRSAQLATLFSSDYELVGLEDWALTLDYARGSAGLTVISHALEQLLPGMQFAGIDKSIRSVMMETVDGKIPLAQLSEGYQAMAAWAGDLLFCMTETFKDRNDPLAARGVLLIDEMDLHLHPVWKRSLIDFLNSAFPNLQFIATTHSPLSIQQCREGELFVVRRNETSAPTLVAFNGDPSQLRLSDLFLSPLIGLETLDSPRVATLVSEAREIELKSGKKTKADITRLTEIQSNLSGSLPLTAEEVPAMAKLVAFQQSQRELDVAKEISEAESLFGTKRPSLGATSKKPRQ
jgi:predicted ATP-binding protein involved in virulence